MIRCIIVDDEPLAIKLLSSYVGKMDHLELVSTFSNPLDALSFVQSNDLDLIFLDIQMPELNGIQLAKVLREKTAIILTTAYPDYAVQGFEIRALDYLVKPISFQRFIEAVQRFDDAKNSPPAESTSTTDYLFIKTEYRLQKVKYDDILFFKGMGDYTSVITKTDRIMTLENMKSFEEKLPEATFIRVHKSYLISLDKIEFIEKNRIGIKGELIPIGATYQEQFWKKIG